MGEPAEKLMPTYADYRAMEEQSQQKHEYYRGEIFAMAGGSPEHSLLSANMIALLGGQLRGKSCRPHTSDLRVQIPDSDLSAYPDVTVICGKVQHSPEDPQAAINPTVIVEVLSKSTEAWDRGEKFEAYRNIPTLKHYVLVSQGRARVEHYQREGAGWRYESLGTADSLELKAISCTLPVAEIYGGVETVR